jgi:hypothetical protein
MGKTEFAHATDLEQLYKSTPVGFEPTRGDPIGLAGRRLSHSAKVSHGGIPRKASEVVACMAQLL